MAYPEVRVFDASLKVGSWMIAGVMLVLAGLLVDVFVSAPGFAGYSGGMLPVAVIFTVACAFIALRVVAVIRLSRSIGALGLPVRHNPTAAPAVSAAGAGARAGPVGCRGRLHHRGGDGEVRGQGRRLPLARAALPPGDDLRLATLLRFPSRASPPPPSGPASSWACTSSIPCR